MAKIKTRSIINDGYTRELFIAPVDGVHQGLWAKYRPMIPTEVTELDGTVERFGADASTSKAAAAAAAGKLVEWSEVDANDIDVKITAESVGRLHPLVFEALLAIIKGHRRSDPMPGETVTETRLIEDQGN